MKYAWFSEKQCRVGGLYNLYRTTGGLTVKVTMISDNENNHPLFDDYYFVGMIDSDISKSWIKMVKINKPSNHPFKNDGNNFQMN